MHITITNHIYYHILNGHCGSVGIAIYLQISSIHSILFIEDQKKACQAFSKGRPSSRASLFLYHSHLLDLPTCRGLVLPFIRSFKVEAVTS